MTQQQPQRSLVRKLNEIMKKVGYLQKQGRNEQQKYNFIQEADVINAVRDLMIEKNLMIFQETEEIIVTQSGTTKGGAQKMLTTIKMKYTIVDGDSGEEKVISTGGQGEDTGDKGIYKATTGANKYGLLKLFQIPTGDDPELDGEPHQSSQKAPGNSQGRNEGNRSQSNQRQRQGPSGGQKDPFQNIERMGMALNYPYEQLMELINAARKSKNAPPVQSHRQLDPLWIAAIELLLDQRLKKMNK